MKYAKKIISSILVLTPFTCLSSSFVSCGKKQEDFTFSVEDKNIVTDDYNFEISFFNPRVKDQVYFCRMQNELSGDITLKNDGECHFQDGVGVLQFEIAEHLKIDKAFSFNIQIATDDQFQSILSTFYDFCIYFSSQPIIDKDTVTIDSKNQQATNNHEFAFTINFSAVPKDLNIYADISNYDATKLSLRTNEYKIIDPDTKPHIIIPLFLDIGVIQSSNFKFDFNLIFTNSCGNKQYETITNCSVTFNKKISEYVPDDYFDITTEGNDYILNGIKENVNLVDLSHYTICKIPDNVSIIKANAFSPNDAWKNINHLIIPKSVHSIDSNTFTGICNLTEIDLSDYETTPEWVNTTNIFDSNLLNFNAGYVWYSKIENLDSYLSSWGLLDKWNSFDVDLCIPEECFQLNADKKTLTKIVPTPECPLENYKIIKIPETVETIGENAFELIRQTPFIRHDSSTNILETRRIIFGKNIKNIGKCSNIGVGGPILMYSPVIETFASMSCEWLNLYGDPGLLNIEEEPLQLELIKTNNLTSISDFAFNCDQFQQDKFVIPKNVLNIGQYAFQGNLFKSIVFTNPHLIDVGEECFSNSYFAVVDPVLNSIDLSVYNIIQNPSEEEEDQSYIPSWFNDQLHIFLSACAPTGNIYISKKIYDEIKDKDEDIDDWEEKISLNLGLPKDGWTFNYID